MMNDDKMLLAIQAIQEDVRDIKNSQKQIDRSIRGGEAGGGLNERVAVIEQSQKRSFAISTTAIGGSIAAIIGSVYAGFFRN